MNQASRSVPWPEQPANDWCAAAKRNRAASGLPLSAQEDDFLTTRQSDWQSGLV